MVSDKNYDGPVRLASNEYWGHRSGAYDAKKKEHFPGRRGSLTARQEHQGASGKKAHRFHQKPRQPY